MNNNNISNNGVINGYYLTNFDNQNSINNRIFDNNLINQEYVIEHKLPFRPTPTKYVKMPMVDIKNEVKEFPKIDASRKTSYISYPQNGTFNSYMSNIQDESELRNQFNKLSKNDFKSYVPSSNSDLYRDQQFNKNVNLNNHNLLFVEPEHSPINRNKFNLEDELFNNHTRQQRNFFEN